MPLLVWPGRYVIALLTVVTLGHAFHIERATDRMRAALMRACPHLNAQQVRQRFAFSIGAIMNQVYSRDAHLQAVYSDGSPDELVAFIAAGFRG